MALSIADPADGYHFVALVGIVDEIVADQPVARGDIIAMARRYHADDQCKAEEAIGRFETQRRISFRVRITAFHDHLA